MVLPTPDQSTARFCTAASRPLPKPYAPQQSRDVFGALDFARKVDGDLARVAAPQVERVVVEGFADLLDRPRKHAIPLLAAEPGQGALPQHFFVGPSFSEGVVPELDVRHVSPVDEEREAETGAERHAHLDTLALDGAMPLHPGVIENPDRLVAGPPDRGREIETSP